MNLSTYSKTRRFLYVFTIFLISFVLQISFVSHVFALDEKFMEINDIYGYNPKIGACSAAAGTLGSPAPSELTGANNPEKVWNYFIARGLTPVGAASAMGNMEQESSAFDPWAGESGNKTISKEAMGVGFGIIQWTNTGGNSQGRRYGVMKHLEDNGVRLDASDLSQADQALLLELNWLWDGEYSGMTWQDQVNKETTVDGDPNKSFSDDNTGNGGAMVFHALVERSGDGAPGKKERIESAKKFLEQFGNSITGTGGSGCSAAVDGGLNVEQAKQFMMKYGENIGNDSITAIRSGVGRPAEDCNGGALSNCTSFSAFFLNKFTDLKYQGGNGNEVVKNLEKAGAKSGIEPQVYSVFSNGKSSGAGHTGIILGKDGDNWIVGHASCSSPGSGKGDGTEDGGGAGWVEVGPLPSALLYSDQATYAYPGTIKTTEIQSYIGG